MFATPYADHEASMLHCVSLMAALQRVTSSSPHVLGTLDRFLASNLPPLHLGDFHLGAIMIGSRFEVSSEQAHPKRHSCLGGFTGLPNGENHQVRVNRIMALTTPEPGLTHSVI